MNLSRASARKARIEMVPLIDSFFLLLAFFISSVLSMSMVGALPIELPRVAGTVTLEPNELLVITVARDGQLHLDGHSINLDDLTTRLKTDPRASTLRVAVRTDRLVPAGRLLEVLGAVRGAGIHHVGLVTNLIPEAASVS